MFEERERVDALGDGERAQREGERGGEEPCSPGEGSASGHHERATEEPRGGEGRALQAREERGERRSAVVAVVIELVCGEDEGEGEQGASHVENPDHRRAREDERRDREPRPAPTGGTTPAHLHSSDAPSSI